MKLTDDDKRVLDERNFPEKIRKMIEDMPKDDIMKIHDFAEYVLIKERVSKADMKSNEKLTNKEISKIAEEGSFEGKMTEYFDYAKETDYLIADYKWKRDNGLNERKYELTDETIEVDGHTLHRIKALKDFGDVKKGKLGGFIEKEENLSQKGLSWVGDSAFVYENARVFENAKVYENVWVYGNARVYGNAQVTDDARVYDNAWVYGNAKVSKYAYVYDDAIICDNAEVYEDAQVSGNAKIYEKAQVSGTAQVYGNAKVYGSAEVYDGTRIYDDAQVYEYANVGGKTEIYEDAEVSGDAWVYGNACVFGDTKVTGNARVYGDSEISKGEISSGRIDGSGKNIELD